LLQISPFERARRADLELLAQGLWIMVVDQLQRLAGQQRIEAAKNQGVALAGRNFATSMTEFWVEVMAKPF
jgi:hypothetical protein